MANKLVEIFIQVRDEASGAFDRLKGAIGRVGDSVLSLKGLLLGLIGGAIVKGVESLVDAFMEQEKVTVRLNSALRVSGRFTQEASDAIHKMADDMRTLTTHTDEEALGVSATFASLARELTVEQLAQAQKVAIGLADATGKSLEAASMMIVRSLTGQGNALKRWGVDLDTSGTQQEKFNRIQEKLGPLFNISVESAKTLAGSIAQAKNEFNELKETLGTVIVNSLGLAEKTHALRDLFVRWNAGIKEHVGEWVKWGKIVVDLFAVIGRSLLAAVQLAFNAGKGFGAALSLGIDTVVLAISSFVNDRIVPTINKAFEGLDALAQKFGKSFKFRVEGIDTESVKDQIAIDLNTWQEAVEGVDGALQGVRDSYGRLIKDVKAEPLPPLTPNAAGAGKNIGQAIDESASELLRGALEDQKLLDAEYNAGVKTFAEYQAGLVSIHDRLTMLRGTSSLTRAETVQLYDALAKIKDVKITGLLTEADKLKESLHAGKMSAAEYDAAIDVLVKQMEKLLRAAGLTEDQIKKLTKSIKDSKDSMVGIGPQMAQAFGLGEGQGGQALIDANKQLASMSFALGSAFTDALAQAALAGGGFGKVIEKAVGQAAAANAKLALGRSLMEVAEGIAASIFAPAEAAKHFAAAKVFAGAAAFMGSIAGATGGFSGGGGGGGGGSSNVQSATAGTASRGTGNIVVEGGILDMTDPRQADAFNKAVKEMVDRGLTPQIGG